MRALKLSINSALLISGIVLMGMGCSSSTFLGRVTSPPQWLKADLNRWVSEVDQSYQGRVFYGRGLAQGHRSIRDRRSIAESKAVQDAQQRLIEYYLKKTKRDQEREILNRLSWVEIAYPVERFFDPESNTQYVLVAVTQRRLANAVDFSLRSLNSTSGSHYDVLRLLLSNLDELFAVSQ